MKKQLSPGVVAALLVGAAVVLVVIGTVFLNRPDSAAPTQEQEKQMADYRSSSADKATAPDEGRGQADEMSARQSSGK